MGLYGSINQLISSNVWPKGPKVTLVYQPRNDKNLSVWHFDAKSLVANTCANSNT
jgi:hypothetical protein